MRFRGDHMEAQRHWKIECAAAAIHCWADVEVKKEKNSSLSVARIEHNRAKHTQHLRAANRKKKVIKWRIFAKAQVRRERNIYVISNIVANRLTSTARSRDIGWCCIEAFGFPIYNIVSLWAQLAMKIDDSTDSHVSSISNAARTQHRYILYCGISDFSSSTLRFEHCPHMDFCCSRCWLETFFIFLDCIIYSFRSLLFFVFHFSPFPFDFTILHLCAAASLVWKCFDLFFVDPFEGLTISAVLSGWRHVALTTAKSLKGKSAFCPIVGARNKYMYGGISCRLYLLF